jgi:hypothetical protein
MLPSEVVSRKCDVLMDCLTTSAQPDAFLCCGCAKVGVAEEFVEFGNVEVQLLWISH